MLLTANRLTDAIAKVQERIDALSANDSSTLDLNLAIDASEHFAYQQEQARAHASGFLTADEAQVIYIALGEVGDVDNGGWAKGATTATKVIVTQVIGELLGRRLGR